MRVHVRVVDDGEGAAALIGRRGVGLAAHQRLLRRGVVGLAAQVRLAPWQARCGLHLRVHGPASPQAWLSWRPRCPHWSAIFRRTGEDTRLLVYGILFGIVVGVWISFVIRRCFQRPASMIQPDGLRDGGLCAAEYLAYQLKYDSIHGR